MLRVQSQQLRRQIARRLEQVDIELEVALEDGRHFEARVRELAPQMYAARVAPGSAIGVRADASDILLLTLDWLRELDT